MVSKLKCIVGRILSTFGLFRKQVPETPEVYLDEAEMKRAIIALREFMDSNASSTGFYLRSGQLMLGWLEEVYDDGFIHFYLMGPMADPDGVKIAISDIRIDTISYWDEERQVEVKFYPFE